MRPESIKKFEIFYLVSWGIGLIGTFVSWDTQLILASRTGRGLGLGLYATVIAIGLMIPPMLCYFFSRKRSEIARWLIIGLFAVQVCGVTGALVTLSFTPGLIGALSILVFIVRAIAVRYLFNAETREWLEAVSAATPIGPAKE